jgi:alkylation response protein AidB-like acyl-CoA dehydrogenase
MLVGLYGTDAQRAAFARAVRAGALAGVWGADGADPLVADVSGESVRLQGSKILASGAGLADAAVATARTADGPLMVMLGRLPAQRIDVSAWTPLGMTGSATGRVDLTGLSVPAESVLGRAGDFLRQPSFSGGAWRFCAAHLGAAERLLDLYRTHLVERGRADDPYQLQRIATCTTAVTTAAFWVSDAARRLADPEQDATRTVAFANFTRTVTERAALDVIETVERGIGLSALVRPHPAERVIRDLSTYLRQPVPDLAMADAARAVLASDRQTAELWT